MSGGTEVRFTLLACFCGSRQTALLPLRLDLRLLFLCPAVAQHVFGLTVFRGPLGAYTQLWPGADWPGPFPQRPLRGRAGAPFSAFRPPQPGALSLPDLLPSVLCAAVPERPCPSAVARVQSGRSFVRAAWPRRVSGVSAGWGARLASPGSVVPGPAACAEPRGRCGPRAPERAEPGVGRGVIGARGRGRRVYAAGPPGGRGGGEGVNRLGGI